MSDDYRVPYTKILDIKPHNNAEKLEIATVYGWQVIVRKGIYKPGDQIVYVPIDSVLTPELEKKIFGEDSKVKLHKHRVRQIRLRGLASQGMCIDPKDLSDIVNFDYVDLETDLSSVLNIQKYEPPTIGPSQTVGKDRQRNKKEDNPFFRKFNGVNNIKWFPDLFKETDEVIIQYKVHGTHVRFAKAPFVATTFWRKLQKFFGLAPKFANLYGSNNVEISKMMSFKGFYQDNIYGRCLEKYNVFNKIKDGEFVHGEIYGDGIQKGYSYGCSSGEHKLIIFDVRVLLEDGKQKWLNPEEVEAYAKERGFDFVPVLYRGPFNKEFAYTLAKGPSALHPSQKVREGCVVKDRYNYDNEQNKKALKIINEDYLNDPTNTDFQ